MYLDRSIQDINFNHLRHWNYIWSRYLYRLFIYRQIRAYKSITRRHISNWAGERGCIYLPLQSTLPSTSQLLPLPHQQDRVLESVSNQSIHYNKMNPYLAAVEQHLEYRTRGQMQSKHVCTRCARQQRSSVSNCQPIVLFRTDRPLTLSYVLKYSGMYSWCCPAVGLAQLPDWRGSSAQHLLLHFPV